MLYIADAFLLLCAGLFTLESIREKEHRAPKVGIAGISLSILLGVVIFWVPALHPLIAAGFIVSGVIGIIFLLLMPANSNQFLEAEPWSI